MLALLIWSVMAYLMLWGWCVLFWSGGRGWLRFGGGGGWVSGTTRVLLAHLPLLLNCGHLCLQGWGNTHNFCCSCSLLNYYYYYFFFLANLCFVQYTAASFVSLFLLCIKWEVRLWVKLTWWALLFRFIHSVHQIVVSYGTVHCKYLYAPLFVYAKIIKYWLTDWLINTCKRFMKKKTVNLKTLSR